MLTSPVRRLFVVALSIAAMTAPSCFGQILSRLRMLPKLRALICHCGLTAHRGRSGKCPKNIPMAMVRLPASQPPHPLGCRLPRRRLRSFGYGHEGHEIVRLQNERACVCRDYLRLPTPRERYGHPSPSQDAMRAVRLVRRTQKNGISIQSGGVWGFSGRRTLGVYCPNPI